MSFNQKILEEYAAIQGRKINVEGQGVRVEDLVAIGGEPTVMLSDDTTMPLMEAVNCELWEAPIDNESKSGGGGSHFPQVEYDENGIPKNLANVATNEEEMMQVDTSLNGPGTGKAHTIPSFMSKVLPKLTQSPLKTLLDGAKKDNRECKLTFHMKVVNPNLYTVLKESYPDEDIDNIVATMLATELMENMIDTIKHNLDEILNSPIVPEIIRNTNDPEKEKDSSIN